MRCYLLSTQASESELNGIQHKQTQKQINNPKREKSRENSIFNMEYKYADICSLYVFYKSAIHMHASPTCSIFSQTSYPSIHEASQITSKFLFWLESIALPRIFFWGFDFIFPSTHFLSTFIGIEHMWFSTIYIASKNAAECTLFTRQWNCRCCRFVQYLPLLQFIVFFKQTLDINF